MKLFRLLLIISTSVMMMGCIERISTNKKMESAYENAPRIIRDTIIIRDTVVREDVAEVEKVEPAQEPTVRRSSNTATTTYRRNDDDIDRSNSGFFDQYRESYAGDPNAGIEQRATKRVVQKGNAEEVERQRREMQESINLLEKRNAQEVQRQKELEREREAYNAKAVEDAKKQQEQQRQKQQQQNTGTRGKTLNTDLTLKRE